MDTKYDIVIIGAGLTGLSTGYFLKRFSFNDFIVLEKEEKPGGLCRTEQQGNFLFDYCGHLLHFDSPDMKELAGELLKGNFATHTRKSKIYSCDVFTNYPFQCNLFGLPHNVIIECIESFVYAHYVKKSGKNDSSFGAWVTSTLGKGIAEHFMLPYNEKLWACDPYQLTTEWMKEYVPLTDLRQLLTGAFSPSTETSGYNAHFNYPAAGGIEELIKTLAITIQDNISLSNEIVQIDPGSKSITLRNGDRINYKKLISTMPLKELIQKSRGVPQEISTKNDFLQCSGVLNINLAIRGMQLPNISWVYFPEKKYVFYRIGFYSSFAPENCLPGTTSLYVEIAYRDSMPDKQALYNKTIKQLLEIGILSSPDEILERCILDIPYAYVTYDNNWKHSRYSVHEWLNENEIFSIGRYGSWEYSDMEASMLQAQQTVKEILQ